MPSKKWFKHNIGSVFPNVFVSSKISGLRTEYFFGFEDNPNGKGHIVEVNNSLEHYRQEVSGDIEVRLIKNSGSIASSLAILVNGCGSVVV